MRIAVTGATGFIGKYVVESLIKQGHQVLCVGRSIPSDQQSSMKFVQTNLLEDNRYSWLSEYKPSHLLHLAWYAEHGKFWHSPVNIDWCHATVKLIEAFCDYGGKRVVVAGSCAEYDWSFGYCQEKTTPSNPSTLYGISKDSARRMSTEICRINGVSLAWGRIFFPFGIGEDSNKLIPSIIQSFIGQKEPFSIGISQWRDILPVEIVADALVFLVTQSDSGIYNICSGQPTKISEIIIHIADILSNNPDILISRDNQNDNSPHFLVGDNTAISLIGWKPKYNLQDNLTLYAKALQENLNSRSFW